MWVKQKIIFIFIYFSTQLVKDSEMDCLIGSPTLLLKGMNIQ